MAPRTPPGQLDIPLVWENGPGDERRSADRGADDPPPAPAFAAGLFRLWLSTIGDAAISAVGMGVFLTIAAILGAELTLGQIALTAGAGLAAVTVIAFGSVWGWRATPGMLLLGVCFSQAIPFGRACRLWLTWMLCLPLAGLPLLVVRRGESGAERLAGGVLSRRSRLGGA
jgi:hypothetical protein